MSHSYLQSSISAPHINKSNGSNGLNQNQNQDPIQSAMDRSERMQSKYNPKSQPNLQYKPYYDIEPDPEENTMDNLLLDDREPVTSFPSDGNNGPENKNGPNGDKLGRKPIYMECPWCHAVITTNTKKKIRKATSGAVVAMALICWPIFWAPLFVPQLKRVVHYCPACHRKIGRGHHRKINLRHHHKNTQGQQC